MSYIGTDILTWLVVSTGFNTSWLRLQSVMTSCSAGCCCQ